MVEGTVKFFNRTNHYGFIDGDDNEKYFVHESGLADGTSIDEGDRVSFEAVQGDKGPKAEKVKKLEAKEAEAEEAPAEEKAETEEAPAEEAEEKEVPAEEAA